MAFQSYLTTWAEPDRGIVALHELELELLGVGGVLIMDELEPLEKLWDIHQPDSRPDRRALLPFIVDHGTSAVPGCSEV